MGRGKRPIRIGQVWEKTGFGNHRWHLTVIGLIDISDFPHHGDDEWLYVLLGRNVIGRPYLIVMSQIGVRREAHCVRDLSAVR